MRKKMSTVLFFTIGMLLLIKGPIMADNTKTAALNRKISEISLARKDIAQKISHATDIRNQLQQQMEELIGEIISEKKLHQLQTFQDAVKNLRIDFDLKLVQQLRGYIQSINTRIAYFENADDTLDYYSRQIQDDLQIIKTLNDFEVDHLIGLINAALDEYIPETNKYMINIQVVQWIDSEKLWCEITDTKP